MNSAADEIISTIRYAMDKKAVRCDRTWRSVVKRTAKKGYVILDDAGNERTVPCSIPGIELQNGQTVWVKEPMGDIRQLHICGIA